MTDDLQALFDEGGPTIELPAGHYAGPITVRRDVTLVGAGANKTIIESTSGQPVLRIKPGLAVELHDLTLAGGDVPLERGGVVTLTDGRLRVVGCTLTGSRAVLGGALHAGHGAELVVEETRIIGNVAIKGGGGLAVTDGARVWLTRVSFSHNVAADGGHHLYVMGRPGAAPHISVEYVTWSECAGRGSSIANVRGFEGRFTLKGTPWPKDSLKVPQHG